MNVKNGSKFKKTGTQVNEKLTGLLPVPTGSLSSSKGDGILWKAQISAKHCVHLPAFSAIHAP